MILLIESVTAIWNFLIHTEKIKKLGFLDEIFNTPSNHRVHHASNPEYIDKNLGGILIIYDRLFGTYAKETIPRLCITHNIHTQSRGVLMHEYRNIFKRFKDRNKKRSIIQTGDTIIDIKRMKRSKNQNKIYYSPLTKQYDIYLLGLSLLQT
jgi:hypothetical protein